MLPLVKSTFSRKYCGLYNNLVYKNKTENKTQNHEKVNWTELRNLINSIGF